jgi:hypothetical protein
MHSIPFISSNRPRVPNPNLPRPSFPQTPGVPVLHRAGNCYSSDSAKTITPLNDNSGTPKALHQPDHIDSDPMKPRKLHQDFQTVVRNPRLPNVNRNELPSQDTSPDLPRANFLSMALGDDGGHGDDDTSIHEVELNESELKEIDDDFSDIGDFDVTTESLDIFQPRKKNLSLIREEDVADEGSTFTLVHAVHLT